MSHAPAIPTHIGDRALRLVDSITELTPADAGCIAISGSHGGRSAARYAQAVPLALCCLNDAGVGKDRAGVVALDILQAAGIACVTVAHDSARIGDARDAWEHGVISFANAAARQRGLRPGAPLREEIGRVFGAR